MGTALLNGCSSTCAGTCHLVQAWGLGYRIYDGIRDITVALMMGLCNVSAAETNDPLAKR